MDRFGSVTIRRRWCVLAAVGAGGVLAGILSTGTLDALVPSRWQSPGSESMRAAEVQEAPQVPT